jgi:DNA-binding transcriptional ArsR family regulator
MADGMPSPQLLEEYSQFFRLLSEPARLQLLCQLKQGPLDVAALMEATGFPNRTSAVSSVSCSVPVW